MKINKTKRNINLGIEFLRFLLCLWVVIIHCSTISRNHKKYLFRQFHVPTFILMSFYFYYGILINRIKAKIILRFQRLFIPYISWAIIIFIFNNFLFNVFSQGIYDRLLTIKDLYIQFLVGAGFHTILWFQFNLIILSLFFTILSFLYKKDLLEKIILSGVASLYLHISGLNNIFFNGYRFNFVKNIATIFELMPLAAIGILLGSLGFLNFLLTTKNYSISSHFSMILLVYILFKYDIFIDSKGFRYSNILLNMFASTILFACLGSFRFDNCNILKLILWNITKFTGGIYYIHNIIRRIFNKFSEKKDYFRAFNIYIICYIICLIGNKIFKNSKLKYLFL